MQLTSSTLEWPALLLPLLAAGSLSGRRSHCRLDRDVVLACHSMTNISTSASVVIPRPREEVFSFATDMTNTPRTIRPRGPFAGIRNVEMHEGHSLAKGSKRRIFMTDDSVLDETILEYDPPLRHRYRWTGGVKPPFSLLVRSGTGNWDFTETEGGTRIVWTYTFGLTSPLAYPLAMPIAWLFKGFLQQGLDALRAELLA